MKKLLLIFTLFYFNYGMTQSLPNFDEIKLESGIDYKASETYSLTAANYILSTPYLKDDLSRLKSLQFIITWMEGTPDYSFTLDKVTSTVTKGNDDLLGIYLACMVKYCLENTSNSKDEKLVKLGSVKLLLAYCENPSNNIKLTKQLKKLSEANQKGELEKELN